MGDWKAKLSEIKPSLPVGRIREPKYETDEELVAEGHVVKAEY